MVADTEPVVIPSEAVGRVPPDQSVIRRPMEEDPTRSRVLRKEWEDAKVALAEGYVAAAIALIEQLDIPAQARRGMLRFRIHALTIAQIEVRLQVVLQTFLDGSFTVDEANIDIALDRGERFASRLVAEALGVPEEAAAPADPLDIDPNIVVVFDVPTPPEVRQALIDANSQLSQSLGQEMFDRIMAAVRDGVLDGKGIPDITRRVREVTHFSSSRSRMIARTESIRAFAEAAESRYQGHGIELWEWIATNDERTDPDCNVFDGLVFRVRGPSPPLPLHPNCRCAKAPVILNRDQLVAPGLEGTGMVSRIPVAHLVGGGFMNVPVVASWEDYLHGTHIKTALA